MLLRPQGKGVHVDALIRSTGVRLVRLNPREVGSLTLGEAVLAVELELRRDDGVLSPAVHVEGGLREDEGTGIGDKGLSLSSTEGASNTTIRLIPSLGASLRISSGIIEPTRRSDEGSRAGGEGREGSERGMGVGEGINRISVVEGLGSKNTEETGRGRKTSAVVNVLVRLNNPNKLLDGVVEVELDLVGGGPNGLVSGELELSDEVLVGVLGHASALISVEEDIVDVEGGRNKGLLVRRLDIDGLSSTRGERSTSRVRERGDGPEALVNRAQIKVDLDLVVLESNQRERKARVGAEPELEGNVEGGLREGVAGSANLARRSGLAGAINGGEGRIGDEGKLGGVTNHLEVSTLLLGGHGELIPDVHPVSVLAVDALASNLNLNLGNELLSGEVQPAGINSRSPRGSNSTGVEALANLGESDLEVGAVSKISVAADRALNTASEIRLSIERLLNRLNGEVRVPAVGDLPESDLRVSSQINVLSSVSNQLH